MEGQAGGVPDRATLAAFGASVMIGGLNFVAVRFSNRELEPFFGAGARFAAASLLLLGIVALRRIPLPRGRALAGVLIYGVLSFMGAYAFAYWALLELPAGVAGVVMASVPLITVVLASLHGVERLRPRGLGGALLAIAGIAVILNPGGGSQIALPSLLAMVGAAACAAESGVILKMFPRSHPLATNGIAMASGSVLLLALSAVTGESWTVPSRPQTWLAAGYLVTAGSVALFALYLFALRRWTASGVSFQFVLFPIVAVLAGALLAREAITAPVAIGGGVVLAGVYVGALSSGGSLRKPRPAPAGASADR